MANEINLSVSLSFSKSGVDFAKSTSVQINKSDSAYSAELQDFDATPVKIVDSGVKGHGVLLVINRGVDNLNLGSSSGSDDFAVLAAGEPAVITLQSNADIYAWCEESESASAEVIWLPTT